MNLDLLETILDVAFVGLLVAVLIYAVRLNRNIGVLQESKEELQALMGQFVTSTERAEEALQRIKNRSRDATVSIDDAIEEAKALKMDLLELIRRAEEVAGPVGIAAAKAERGQATYRSGYSGGPAKAASKGPKAKKTRAKKAKAAAAMPREAKPAPDMDMAALDAEIDKDLEARLAKLIESVEAGEAGMTGPVDPQSDMFASPAAPGEGLGALMEELAEQDDATAPENAQDSKAKSKEELLKALRGMR